MSSRASHKPALALLSLAAFVTISFLPARAADVPQAKHVFLVVLENQNYDDIMNGSMPFLGSLARQYASSSNYFANTHPSIGNYFMLTTSQVITNNDGYDGEVGADNLVRALLASGKTWASYAQSLPSVGFLGNQYPYRRRHNPFAYLTDVTGSPAQRSRLVPLQQFTADLAAGSLPDFAFLLPDFEHDMHDCPGGGHFCRLATRERAADEWLKAWLQPLIASPAFRDGGLLILTFDESDNDDRHGGGLIPFLMIGPNVKPGYVSHALYQHQNTLRTICDALRLKSCPGTASSAQPMSDFFIQVSPSETKGAAAAAPR